METDPTRPSMPRTGSGIVKSRLAGTARNCCASWAPIRKPLATRSLQKEADLGETGDSCKVHEALCKLHDKVYTVAQTNTKSRDKQRWQGLDNAHFQMDLAICVRGSTGLGHNASAQP